MTMTIPNGGRFSPDDLARHAEPTARALGRIHDDLRPRLSENDQLRGAVGGTERRIGTLERQVADHQRTVAQRSRDAAADGRTAVREARAGLVTAREELRKARLELPRQRAAYDRHTTALESDIGARLARDAPGARNVIDEVRDEALADQRAARTGPDEDVIRAYGAPRTVRRFFNDWNPLDWNGALDFENDSRVVRMNEADRSINMYQRLRRDYERLRPRATDRLPYEPQSSDE